MARLKAGMVKIKDLGNREKILRAAEELFAAHGVVGVSYRQITSRAKVNLASLNYHFGSKESLVAEIFEFHAGPIVEKRKLLLSQCNELNSDKPMLEQVIEAFLIPAMEVDDNSGSLSFMHLRARLSQDRNDFARKLFYDNFDATTGIFIEKMIEILPHLTKTEVYWRFNFFLGCYIYTAANPGRIQSLTNGECNPGNKVEAIPQLIRFAAAGFRAPSDSDCDLLL